MERSSYLIQRLMKPHKVEDKLSIFANAFCFGGGLKHGGLNQEVWDILKKICRFDYMGSAEFEFGAVPEAFNKIAQYNKLAFALPIPYYFKSWKDNEVKEGTKLVYIICKDSDKDEVVKRIVDMAVRNPKCRTKERVQLDEAMGEHEYAKDNVGWLELDNGYMFFIDEQMFKQFCVLFNIMLKKEE